MAKRTPKSRPEEIEYAVGSGNVYADFGFPNPEEAKAKAKLASALSAIPADDLPLGTVSAPADKPAF